LDGKTLVEGGEEGGEDVYVYGPSIHVWMYENTYFCMKERK